MKRFNLGNSVGMRVMMLAIALFTVLPLLAQHSRPRYPYRTPGRYHYAPRATDVYFGLRLGLDVATVNSDDRYLDGGSAKTGLNVGFVTGFQLVPATPIYFETGLSYMEKGGKGLYDSHKFTYGLNYLELPLVLKYMVNVNRDFTIQPYAGGFVSLGVGGKIKDFGERKAYSSYDDDGFQRWDAGLRIGCGLQFNYLYAEIGYDIGLANVSHDYFDTSRTGCFYTTVGVNF